MTRLPISPQREEVEQLLARGWSGRRIVDAGYSYELLQEARRAIELAHYAQTVPKGKAS